MNFKTKLAFFILNIILVCNLFVFSAFKNNVFAQTDETPNNIFGMHLAQPHLEDLGKVKDLVNSNGGDWGYITLIIQENDRSKDKWQEIFNRLRELHLIPIIRLATSPEGDNWKRPNKDEADAWVNFLDSLNWVVKDRYIILFNEPNHATEWGGSVDPDSFADISVTFAKKLKEKNTDFFVMLGAIDASAPQMPPNYMDEEVFLKSFFDKIKADQFNDLFFGLASHSYPNPGFSGLPDMTGRGTIRTYEWELDLLKSFGVKELPVFITETGWKRQGILDENVVAQYYKSAFENVWLKDRRVRAVTPFVFDYQSNPFLGFSWKLPQAKVGLENEFYPQYYAVQAEEKVKGMPEQVEKGEMLIDFPHELLVNSSYHFRLKLKNLGQSIWDKDEGYVLKIAGTSNDEQKYFFSDLKNVRPFETSDIDFYFKTDDKSADNKLIINLYKGDKKILADREWDFKTLPLPSLSFTASLYPKLSTVGDDFEIQIFDDKETLVFDKKQTSVAGGKGLVKEIQNIALGRRYRVVLLKKYYLPRQEYIVFRQKGNQIKFKRMYPFDFNTDGRFDLQDLSAFIKNPALINLFFL